jgi:hypothetical protein
VITEVLKKWKHLELKIASATAVITPWKKTPIKCRPKPIRKLHFIRNFFCLLSISKKCIRQQSAILMQFLVLPLGTLVVQIKSLSEKAPPKCRTLTSLKSGLVTEKPFPHVTVVLPKSCIKPL